MENLSTGASLDDVIQQMNNLTAALKPLIEKSAPTSPDLRQQATAFPPGGVQSSLGTSGAPNSAAVSSRTHLQDSYESVKDCVSNIQLPPEWKFRESPRGITQEYKDAYLVVKDSAKYSETALKYLYAIEVDKFTQQDLDNLILVQRAQLELLGDKYATLRVKSTSKNKAVGTLFESQLAGTSGFSQRHLDAWHRVSQIASNGGFGEHREGRGRGRGYRGSRGGFQRGNFRGRGFNNYMRDIPDQRADRVGDDLP